MPVRRPQEDTDKPEGRETMLRTSQGGHIGMKRPRDGVAQEGQGQGKE